MLEGEMLQRAFRVFDSEGKGHIGMADLQRVLQSFGQSSVGGDWMTGATDGDREGRRITYGSFVRLMTHAVKQKNDAGDLIFRQGEPVRFFYCLLDGEVREETPSGYNPPHPTPIRTITPPRPISSYLVPSRDSHPKP